MSNMQPLTLEDFSGGITDYYIGAALNKYQRADNLLLYKHGQAAKLITRPGSVLLYPDHPRITSADRINALHDFDGTLLVQSGRSTYYLDTGWQEILGPDETSPVFPSPVTSSSVVSTAEWNGHVFMTTDDQIAPVKVFRDETNALQVRTAGLPNFYSEPTTTADTPGTDQYIYGICYKYTYKVGTLTFIDRGPVKEFTATISGAVTALNKIKIEFEGDFAPPAGTDNRDWDSIKVEMYRTTINGQILYWHTQFDTSSLDGTIMYDTWEDNVVSTRETLYTTGGVVDNDTPPPAKYVHITEDHGYYANVTADGELYPNRVYQSLGGDPDSVPASFYAQVDGEITGLSSVKGTPIVFCKNGSVYRLEGRIDYLGQGDMVARKIAETARSNSPRSIVQTLDGVYFCGLDGFYYCDGYTVAKVNDDIDQTYRTLTSTEARQRAIYGGYDPRQRRVWWACTREADATDNDACFVLDLNYGVSTRMPFTTASGGSSFAPSAILFVDGELIRADKRGYLLKHLDNIYVDPRVEVLVDPADWVSQTIIYDYLSPAIDFGVVHVRKFVPRINVVCQNETNLSLQINVINDDGRKTGALKPVRFRGNIVWGDESVIWGDPGYVWDQSGLVDEWRRVPANNLRCNYLQLHMTNAHVAVLSSDLVGVVDVDSVTKTVALSDTASGDFPASLEDYRIAFASDGFVTEYVIASSTADDLVYLDPANASVDAAGSAFVIRGHPKGEVLSLLAVVVQYTVFGRTQQTYTGVATGEVST